MAVAKVQSAKSYPGNSVAFSSNNTLGNFLIAVAQWNDTTSDPNLSDTRSNAWTAVGKVSGTPNGGPAISIKMWYKANCAAGANTVTMSSNPSDCGISVYEYSGMSAGSVLDLFVTTTAPSPALSNVATSSSITTTATDLIFVAWGDEGTAQSSWTPGTGYTLGETDTGHYSADEYKVSVAAGTYSPFITHGTQNSTTWMMLTAAFKEAGSGTSYTLTAGTGSFSLTGQAATLKASRRLPAANGTFTLSGQAAALKRGRRLDAVVGTFAITGQAVAFPRSYRLTAAAGSFALTGQLAALLRSHVLGAGMGAFTLTGEPATLLRGRRLAATVGSFSVTGEPAALLYGRRLAAAGASFALTGNDATLRTSRLLTAAPGTFVLTGIDATLIASSQKTLTAAMGAFILTGQAAALRVSRRMPATGGTFVLSGIDARLLAGHRLNASVGAFTLAGQTASLLRGRILQAGAGAFTLTGLPAALRVARRLTAAPGSFVLTGIPAILYVALPGDGHTTLLGLFEDATPIVLLQLVTPDVELVTATTPVLMNLVDMTPHIATY